MPPSTLETDLALIGRWNSWLEASKGRSLATVAKYRRTLLRLADWLAGQNLRLASATTERLESWSGLELHRAGLGARTRRAVVAALKNYYLWAHRQGHAPGNPAARLEYPAAGRRLPVALTLDSAEKLLLQPDLNTFLGVRDAAIIAILIGCGVRVSGLTALNDGDLMWMRGDDAKERLVVRVTEKGKKQRLIPAPAETRLFVRAYLGHPELDQADRLLESGDKVLFISTGARHVTADKYRGEERRIRPGAVWEIIKKHGRAAGVPDAQLHPHAARHLYGTEFAESDVNQLVTQALMGHEDPKSTGIYTHLAMRRLMRAVDKASPIAKIKTPVSELARSLQ